RRIREESSNPYGKDLATRQAVAAAEVPRPQLHALQALRPSARRVQEVRPLPDLPARARAPGRDSRHDQVVLVKPGRPTRERETMICNRFLIRQHVRYGG